MKTVKSEDLFKDLQVNPRISPQTQGFHDELDEKLEIEELDPKQIPVDLSRSTLWSVFWEIQLQIEHITSEMKVGQTEIV